MKYVYALLALVALGIGLFLYKNSRFGVETPAYRVLERDGAFEVREYPSLTLVGTPMIETDISEGTSFMRLFRYISGSNATEQKIAMTTPVLTSTAKDDRRMSFIVSPDAASEGPPEPTDDDVSIDELTSGRFAAYRFSGKWDRSRFDEATRTLREWMQRHGLEPAEPPILAGYDPPFMPSFLRRNEILIRIES